MVRNWYLDSKWSKIGILAIFGDLLAILGVRKSKKFEKYFFPGIDLAWSETRFKPKISRFWSEVFDLARRNFKQGLNQALPGAGTVDNKVAGLSELVP